MKLLRLSLLSLLAFHSASLLASVPCDENNDPCPQGYSSVDQTWEEEMHAFLLYPLGDPQDETTESLSPPHERRTHTDSELNAIFSYLLDLRTMEDNQCICDSFEIYFNHPHINAEHYLYKAYAQSALDLENYELALTLIQKYVKYIGIKDADSLVTLAKIYTNLDNAKEASYHWYQYFEAVDPDTIDLASCISAAVTSYKSNNLKHSEKYLKYALTKKDEFKDIFNAKLLISMALIFNECKNYEMAASLWSSILNDKPEAITTSEYIKAACDLYICEKYTEARTCLENYHTLVSENEACIFPTFFLGKIYAESGQTEKALLYFNRVLNAPNEKLKELKEYEHTWFSLAAMTYLMQGDEKSAQGFVDLHNTYKPYPHTSQQGILALHGVEKSAKKKKNKRSRQETVQGLHQHINKIEQNRCADLIAKIQLLDFSTFPGEETQESIRQTLIKEARDASATLQQLKQISSGGTAPQGGQTHTILTIQGKINVLEKSYEALKKAHDNALSAHKKSRARTFLETLDVSNNLMAFTPHEPTNIRRLYGYDKLVSSAPTQTTTMTTTTTNIPQEAPPLPQVFFFQLRSIEKDLITLKRIPGMAAKYDAFLSEIKQNPTELLFSSGKAKTLVGEKGIYSRRFDKANRLVYRVTKQNDGSFHVVILSVLGHYNDLEAKMEKSRQEKKPQKKANKTKKKNTKGKKK